MADRDLAAKYNARLASKGVTDRKWIVTAGGALILVPAGRHQSEPDDESEPKERLL